jgi:hypothetical protein
MKSTPPFISEQTVLGHGIYLAIVALALFIAPLMLRVFLPFPAEIDWWNRVLALPVFNFGRFVHRQRRGEIATCYQAHGRNALLGYGVLVMQSNTGRTRPLKYTARFRVY